MNITPLDRATETTDQDAAGDRGFGADIFMDPVGYLASHGIEAQLVYSSPLAAAA